MILLFLVRRIRQPSPDDHGVRPGVQSLGDAQFAGGVSARKCQVSLRRGAMRGYLTMAPGYTPGICALTGGFPRSAGATAVGYGWFCRAICVLNAIEDEGKQTMLTPYTKLICDYVTSSFNNVRCPCLLGMRVVRCLVGGPLAAAVAR